MSFIANYPLKSFVQKWMMVLSGFRGYSYFHPYRLMRERALEDTVDYIAQNMPQAIAFNSPQELMAHALKLITLEGIVAEFGVNKGGSVTFIARSLPGKRVDGFDSFEGLPENWHGNMMAKGYFSARGKMPRVPPNVRLYPGWFERSVPEFLEGDQRPAAFLHIDCDLYSPTKTILQAFANRIVPGTILVFDEFFNYPNWRMHEAKAFEEFLRESGRKADYIAYSFQQIAVVIKA